MKEQLEQLLSDIQYLMQESNAKSAEYKQLECTPFMHYFDGKYMAYGEMVAKIRDILSQ